MKFKFCVLPLLIMGLVIGFSGMAFADAVISLKVANDGTYTMDETNALAEIPLLRFSITNTELTPIDVTSISVTKSAAVGDTKFTASVWLDANDNGILDIGDTNLIAAVALGTAATTPVALNIADKNIAAGDSLNLLVTVATLVGAVATDAIELVLVEGDALAIAQAVTTADNSVAALNPGTASNVPDLVIAAGVGSMTAAAHSVTAITAADFPNNKTDHILHRFNLAGDDALISHVVESIELTTVFGVGTAGGDFLNVRIYLDLDNSATVTETDAELLIAPTTIAAGAGTNVYTLTTPVFFFNTATYNLVVTADGIGTAADAGAITTNLTDAVFDGAVSAGSVPIAGAIQTIKALTVVLESYDITGVTGRPNGFIDAVKVTFQVDLVNKAIDDTSIEDDITDGDWTITGSGLNAQGSFNPTYNGDAVDNSYVYIRFTEGGTVTNVPTTSDGTNATPAVDYALLGLTRVKSFDSNYALPDFAAPVPATDKAPPAALSVTVLDINSNGKLDRVDIQFSEVPVGAATIQNGTGLSVPGYVIDVDPVNILAAGAAPWHGGVGLLTKWQLVLTEVGYDTGERPPIEYLSSSGVLNDGAPANLIASWTATAVPVTDGALPTLIKAETADADDDGGFDQLILTFSENVRLNPAEPTLTDAEIVGATNGFEFDDISGHDAVYSFAASGHTGLGTTVLTLAVTEIGSFDTAVMPVIEYNNPGGVGNDHIVDYAVVPNPLAADADFNPVYAQANVLVATDYYLVDGISPRILSATSKDNTGNGKLDGMLLTFSEAMGTTLSTYTTLGVTGHSVSTATVVGVDVTLTLNEVGYDTGDVPDVTYSGTTVVDNNGAPLAAIGSGDVVEKDGAAPIIYKAATVDNGIALGTAQNGQIDGMVIHFSEPMDTTMVNFDGPGTELANEFSFALTYVLADTVWFSDAQTATIPITELIATPDTDIKPDLLYGGILGEYQLQDKAAVPIPLANIITGDIVEVDEAPPAIVAASTVDDDNDGYLDGMTITFSETPVVAVADTAKAQTAVTLSKVENTIVLTSAVVTGAGDALTFVGTSSMDAAGAHPWDTSVLPKVSIAAGSGIKDAATNEVTAIVDYIAATDGAKPIISKTVGQVGSTNVLVTFSEQVIHTGPTAIVFGDITYIDVYTTGTNASAFTAISTADSTLFIATTNNTLLLEDVQQDSIKVVAATVEDLAVVPNAAFAVNVTIYDEGAPTLSAANTLDIDNNGLIDHIELVFSEAVNDTNLVGYVDTESVATDAAPFFSVEGYTVVGLNFTSSVAEAVTAGIDTLLQAGDVDNDANLYLMVDESGIINGDTGVTPPLGMTGGETNSGVSDFTPNFTPDISAYASTDKAPPRIMKAMMAAETKLLVQISELAETTLPDAVGTLIWEVGNQGLDNTPNVLEFTQPSASILSLVVSPGSAIPGGVASTIKFAAADVLNDAAAVANSNVQTAAIDVVPFADVDVTPGAPGNLDIADVPDDNGGWVNVAFTPSTSAAVNSYVLWKDADTTVEATDWEYCGSISNVPLLDGETTLKVKYYVGDNVEYDWKLVASTGTVASDPGDATGGAVVGKAAAGAVIVYEAGAAKIASTPSIPVEATGGATDNIGPVAITGVEAISNPLDTGICVTWNGGVVVDYGKDIISGSLVPIYDADYYEIWLDGGEAPIATVPGASSEYIDKSMPDGGTVYSYYIKAVDSYSIANAIDVMSSVRSAIATSDLLGDFDGSNEVGFADFGIFGANYGYSSPDPGYIPSIDLNDPKDGEVGFSDFGIFGANYGTVGKAVAKGIAREYPLNDVSFGLGAEYDQSTSMYYVDVNISDPASIAGFEFTISYDPDALEMVDEITGLVGLSIPSNEDGIINVASMFMDEEFSGTVTIGFRSNGTSDDFTLELISGFVADEFGSVSRSTDLGSTSLSALPEVYTLSKNFPNPFNPTTIIAYSIPISGKVELVIYNMTGQKVRTLVNEVQDASFHKVMWDGRNDMGAAVSSGLYFYKLVSGNFNKIEKMTLVK